MIPLFKKNKTLSSVWMYRLVRWAFGVFFIIIGILYNDAWAAYIFGGLFIITSFLKPVGCVGGSCRVDKR
jgi:hypothetical protein